MRLGEMQGLAVPAIDIPKRSVTDANSLLQHASKHWLKITEGAANPYE